MTQTFVWMKFSHFFYLFCCTHLWLSSLSGLEKTLTEIPPLNSQKTCTNSKSRSVFVSFSLATRSWSSRRSRMPMLLLSFPVAWRLNQCLLGSRTCATPALSKVICWQVIELGECTHTNKPISLWFYFMEVTEFFGWIFFFFGSCIKFHPCRITFRYFVYLHLINSLTYVWPRLCFRKNTLVLLSSAVSVWTLGVLRPPFNLN